VVTYTGEDEYFPPPRNLRDLLQAVDAAATLAFGGPVRDRPAVNDRSVHASDVLAELG
jgi:4-hydroxy-3-methylbut-2-enyl diphosphate reductase